MADFSHSSSSHAELNIWHPLLTDISKILFKGKAMREPGFSDRCVSGLSQERAHVAKRTKGLGNPQAERSSTVQSDNQQTEGKDTLTKQCPRQFSSPDTSLYFSSHEPYKQKETRARKRKAACLNCPESSWTLTSFPVMTSRIFHFYRW